MLEELSSTTNYLINIRHPPDKLKKSNRQKKKAMGLTTLHV